MTVSVNIDCPNCHQPVACNVDLKVGPGKREVGQYVMNVTPNITDETLQSFRDHQEQQCKAAAGMR